MSIEYQYKYDEHERKQTIEELENVQINCSKEDFETALKIVKKREEGPLGAEGTKSNIAKIINYILILSDEFEIPLDTPFLKEKLIIGLKFSKISDLSTLGYKLHHILLDPDYKENTVDETLKIEELWCNRLLYEPEKFKPYYQKIVDNETGDTKGFESLVRFEDGKGGVIIPFKFLDIFQKNNLLGVLAKVMIDKVIQEMTIHNHNISINMDIELADDEAIEYLFKKLEEYKVDPSRLTVEVLETVRGKISDRGDFFKKVQKNVRKLQENGIEISIDDIGSFGHSTPRRVRELNANNGKIDKGVVFDLNIYKEDEDKSEEDRFKDKEKLNAVVAKIEKLKKEKKELGEIINEIKINKTDGNELTEKEENFNKAVDEIAEIVKECHLYNAKVIAEGVENEFVKEIVTLLGADYTQGYLIEKPNREMMKSNEQESESKNKPETEN